MHGTPLRRHGSVELRRGAGRAVRPEGATEREEATDPESQVMSEWASAVEGAKGSQGVLVPPPIKPSWDLVAIALVYTVQGLLGLSRLAVSYLMKDELGMSPGEAALLTGIALAPWLVKPLYGFLSDAVPLAGYRRRSYLALCGLAGFVSWTTLAMGVSTVPGVVACLALGSLGTACSDVVVDSIVVERSRGEPQSTAGSLQSLCWACQSMGGIASAYLSGWAVAEYGTHPVFAATALFPLLVTASAFLIVEERVEPGTSAAGGGGGAVLAGRLKSQALALWGAVSQREILAPAVFVFLWQATPNAESAMFYFYTESLNFTPEFLGRVTLASKVASLAGVASYNFFLKRVPLRSMFLYTALLGTALGLTQLILVTGLNRQWGLSDELFVLGDSVVLVVLGQVSFMPLLVLAARICPQGVEATLFATLMSILNAGGFVSSASGALLTNSLGVTSKDFGQLALLLSICHLSALLPLPLLHLVPDSAGGELEDSAKAKGKD